MAFINRAFYERLNSVVGFPREDVFPTRGGREDGDGRKLESGNQKPYEPPGDGGVYL